MHAYTLSRGESRGNDNMITVTSTDCAKSEGTVTHLHTWQSIWPQSHSVNTGAKKETWFLFLNSLVLAYTKICIQLTTYVPFSFFYTFSQQNNIRDRQAPIRVLLNYNLPTDESGMQPGDIAPILNQNVDSFAYQPVSCS